MLAIEPRRLHTRCQVYIQSGKQYPHSGVDMATESCYITVCKEACL